MTKTTVAAFSDEGATPPVAVIRFRKRERVLMLDHELWALKAEQPKGE